MLADTDVDNHFNPSIRLLQLAKSNSSNCGFHLSRGKWDPYPWVTSVDEGTAACSAGIKSGDCVIEVNGEDIIGLRVSEVADIVKSKPEQVSLLLWNAGVNPQCLPEALCCGPMPTNLQRLSACMSTILAFLECPVCLDTISPPTYQCDNGHLICIKCRTKSERCPVCRQRFNRGRSLISDQVFNSLTEAFNLKEDSHEAKTAKMHKIFKLNNKNKIVPDIKLTQTHTNKFLAKIIGKASSADNVSNSRYPMSNLCKTEFSSTNLKTKSLSTYEIFQAESPVVTRCNSVTRLNKNEKRRHLDIDSDHQRPASYHGSFESLGRKMDEIRPEHNSLLSLSNQFDTEDGILYHCPFARCCSTLVKGPSLLDHFKAEHKGPLTQYFNSNIQIRLDKIFWDVEICFVVYSGNKTFFFKVLRLLRDDKRDETSNSEDTLIWMWYLGSKKESKEYEMRIEVKNEIGTVLLIVGSAIFSLSSTSFQDIFESKKGVYLNAKTLDALNFSRNNIILDITILETDMSD